MGVRMGIRETQVKALLSELLDAVREWQTPTWPLVKSKPISQMEIGLPKSSTAVLWPEPDNPERAVVVDDRCRRSLHLSDETLAWRVSVTRVRQAIAACRDRIAEIREQAASILQCFPNDVARLEQELSALLLLGAEIPETRQDHRLLIPVAWRIHRLSRQPCPDQKAISRFAADLVTHPIDYSITLTVTTSFTHIVHATVRSEYYKVDVTVSAELGIMVNLEDVLVYDPFAEMPRLARVAPDPFQAVRVMDFLGEILARLTEEQI